MTFTAAQIAAALGMKRQAVQWHLRAVAHNETKSVNGQETSAWSLINLPPTLLEKLSVMAGQQQCRSIEALLTMPRIRWQPSLSMGDVSAADTQTASKLREALRPWFIRQHAMKPGELKIAALASYRHQFGHEITGRYFDEIFERTLRRDNGFEEWNRLEIYLPDRLKRKEVVLDTITVALADDFADLENFICSCGNPHAPNEDERVGLWTLAFVKFKSLIRTGDSEKSAARRVRQFLFARAKFLAPTRNALRMAFERKLDQWQHDNSNSLADGRQSNGDRANYPREDIHCVRHSAVFKNGGRIDSAWREEYLRLSEYTRQRHPRSRKCPRPFYQCVNREKVDALCARVQGKRTLRKLVGSITRNSEGIHTMARWVADDMTANIEVIFRAADGTHSLIQPQIIAVMDYASRKWVGWAMSNDKAPTAELVCAAILDAFRRHGVPKKLFLENGFVFGKSLNVNGKADDQGRTLVAGLAQYGCTIHHFHKMSPTSKGELEKSFDLFQRLMERHPGYTGRLQMLDASEDFKREQRLIRSGKIDGKKYRYTFDEFIQVMRDLVESYNANQQHGHLRGLTPSEAFEAMQDQADPPIKFDNRLHWMLANERYRVTVETGGVSLRHYGRKLQVRGGELPQYVGEELWALVDRKDDSLVSFMTLDYSKTFTVEVCRQPSADESRIATGSTVLANELKKVSQHMRAVDDELKDLKLQFGNPRQDLLAKYRNETPALVNVSNETTRRVILDSRVEDSAAQMQNQRAQIQAKRRQNTANKSKANRLGIPAVLVGADVRSRRALELAEEAASEARIMEKHEEAAE